MRIIQVFFIVFIFLNLSCRKGLGDAGTASHGVFLHFIDHSGKELFNLDSNGEQGYFFDSINLYDLTKSKTELPSCYEDRSKNYLFQQFDELRTQFCPNFDIINRYSYTLVQLKRGSNDTLKCHINTDQIGPSTNFDSVWYNGKLLVYDNKGNLIVVQ